MPEYLEKTEFQAARAYSPAVITQGGVPEKAAENFARVRRCLLEVLTTLPSVLAGVH